MSENTAIEWCDHTFNPWEGCQKVGPGCDHCYAETRNARYNGGTAPNWGPGAPRRRTSAANWKKPLKWNREATAFAEQHGRRQRVFCASLADVFDNAVPWEWRLDLFGLIRDTPNLDWLLLTKRIGNVRDMLDDIQVHGTLAECFPNVRLGATIVNQVEAERDIPKLLAVPAAVRFLSMEPLLGSVDLTRLELDGCTWYDCLGGREHIGPAVVSAEAVDWVIVGGESGHGARPMNPKWALDLRDQCEAAGTPFLFKQWGEWAPIGWEHADSKLHLTHSGKIVAKADCNSNRDVPGQGLIEIAKVGKKRAGRLLDGRTHDGFPA